MSVEEEEERAKVTDYNGEYTPGTRGWSRLSDRTLAVPKNHAKIKKILGEKQKA